MTPDKNPKTKQTPRSHFRIFDVICEIKFNVQQCATNCAGEASGMLRTNGASLALFSTAWCEKKRPRICDSKHAYNAVQISICCAAFEEL